MVSQSCLKVQVKVSKIDLPTFDGNVLCWQPCYQLPLKERFRRVVSKGLCFQCLEFGHTAEVCQKPPCKHCQGKHHSHLHLDSASPHVEEATLESPELPSWSSAPPAWPAVVTSSITASSGGRVILQTVPASLCGSNGCSKVVRCFLDPGSQTSFVRQSVVD